SELKLDVVTAEGIVAVAVDAAGAAGLRPFSYRVPERLADLAAGEAVLVEFGRRQALGIVLGPGAEVEGVETKPILDRVRADGPLEAPEGRPALLRRLRALEAAGRLDLDWTLLAAGSAPRWVRYVRLTPTRDAAANGTSNQRLGPRQQALIGELEAGPANGVSA